MFAISFYSILFNEIGYKNFLTVSLQTFCAKCFERSLDHGSKCPLCRQDMPPFSYFQEHPYNKVIYALCALLLPLAADAILC